MVSGYNNWRTAAGVQWLAIEIAARDVPETIFRMAETHPAGAFLS
jgi:hypothetical protein